MSQCASANLYNALLVCYWPGNAVGCACISQDYTDESLKQTSAPLERIKQTKINKYKNITFSTSQSSSNAVSLFCAYIKQSLQRQVTAVLFRYTALMKTPTLFDLTLGKNTKSAVIGTSFTCVWFCELAFRNDVVVRLR